VEHTLDGQSGGGLDLFIPQIFSSFGWSAVDDTDRRLPSR